MPEANRNFPDTRWSLILQAKSGDTQVRSRAMEELCSTYWPPLYAFARMRGHSVQDAEDHTQSFIARLVHRDSLKNVGPQEAKLRSFLLTSFQRFLVDEFRAGQAAKRGGGEKPVSFDTDLVESNLEINVANSDLSPERIFVRNWTRTLLAQVLNRLGESYRKRGKEAQFEALRSSLDVQGEPDYQAAADSLGAKVETVRVYAHRLRKEYQDLIRMELAETLAEGEDVEEELRFLLSAFASS